MPKAIPYPYGSATDRTLLDKIESDMMSSMYTDSETGAKCFPEFWQVGGTIAQSGNTGYYYLWILEKDPFYGRIVRKYRIDKYGKMVETKDFYKVPTKTDYILWCADRNITVTE